MKRFISFITVLFTFFAVPAFAVSDFHYTVKPVFGPSYTIDISAQTQKNSMAGALTFTTLATYGYAIFVKKLTTGPYGHRPEERTKMANKALGIGTLSAIGTAAAWQYASGNWYTTAAIMAAFLAAGVYIACMETKEQEPDPVPTR